MNYLVFNYNDIFEWYDCVFRFEKIIYLSKKDVNNILGRVNIFV